MATLQQVAGAAGTAGFVTVAAAASNGPPGSLDAAGLHAGFVAAGVVGLLAVLTAFFVPGKQAGDACPTTEAESGASQRSTPVAGH